MYTCEFLITASFLLSRDTHFDNSNIKVVRITKDSNGRCLKNDFVASIMVEIFNSIKLLK